MIRLGGGLPRAAVLWAVLLPVSSAQAVPITVNYTDPAGEGFNDPQLGPARRTAFEFAAGIWSDILEGSVPVVVNATMPALGGTGTTALLGSTKMTSIHNGFPNAPDEAWYGAALANQLSGIDVNGPEWEEIDSEFNSDVDNDTVLGSISWYYGTDAQAGADIDFVTVALHELAHGLNFAPLVNPATGALPDDIPGIYDWWLVRPGVGTFPEMADAERVAAATSQSVYWSGAHVVAALGRLARIYVPEGLEAGSSLSHWDPSLSGELMAPFYISPTHDPGLALPAMLDMGWQLPGASATPVASPTPTPSPGATATPTPTEVRRRRSPQVYVTNFDSGTVSVIDTATRQLATTVPVGDGPINAAASPDGRFVFVANFRSGTVSILRTETNVLAGTVDLEASCYDVAAAPDNRTIYVSNLAEGTVSAVDIVARRVVGSIPVAQQPAGLAMSGDGTLYVAAFGANTVDVVDTALRAVTARVPLFATGPLAISLASSGKTAYVGLSLSAYVVVLDTESFTWSNTQALLQSGYTGVVASIAVSPDGAQVYASVDEPQSGVPFLAVIDVQSKQVVDRVPAGIHPAGLAVMPDGGTIYLADAGSDVVYAIPRDSPYVSKTLTVGRSPMGVAVASAPVCPGDCDADGSVTIDEILQGAAVVLGEASLEPCSALDSRGAGVATIADLLAAVNSALNGCVD